MGSIEYSEEDVLFYGQVQNTEDLIAYHGEDIVALEQSFKDTVDDYLEFISASEMLPDQEKSNLRDRETKQE